MNLKNYTSTVSVINSINKIEHRLAQAGASLISKVYDKDRPIGMLFQLMINGNPITYRLPAKTEKVFDYMKLQRKKPPTRVQLDAIKQQADCTAWKILSDWVDIQVSLIELDQAQPTEIFLPYTFDHKSSMTFYERLKENNFKLLEG